MVNSVSTAAGNPSIAPTAGTTVLLAMESGSQFGRDIIAGAGRWGTQAGWTLVLHQATSSDPNEVRRLAWRPQGILSIATNPETHAALRRLGVPHVDVGGQDPHRSDIRSDEVRVGALAAEHLVTQGYATLVLAMPKRFHDHPRAVAFVQAARQLGRPLRIADATWFDARLDPLHQATALADWLSRIPPPIGILCYNDVLAHGVLLACRRSGLEVPQEVGVLGCDDDRLSTHLGHVALSSVQVAHEEMGWLAARRLARVMAGEPVGDEPLVPPVGIVERRSTDRRRTRDPLVGAAVDWIEQHLAEPIGTEAIAVAVGATRRTLERRVRQELSRSVLDEVHRARLATARTLLRRGRTVAESAVAVGWAPSTLTQVFQERLGVTPGAWRARSGGQWGG